MLRGNVAVNITVVIATRRQLKGRINHRAYNRLVHLKSTFQGFWLVLSRLFSHTDDGALQNGHKLCIPQRQS